MHHDRLVVTHDGSAYVLGRPDLGVYVAVPEPGAVFVRTLQETGSVEDATARASEVAGEPVDGAAFLEGLAGAGLLDPPQVTRGRWIAGVDPAVVAPLFGPVAWCVYGLAAVTAIGLLIARPELRPSFADALFLPDPVLSTLIFLVMGHLVVAMHETWHWLAGRAAGVPAAFRVSYRGFYLVFETDLSHLNALPRRSRYGPFLAGMALDATVLAVALLLRLAHHTELLMLAPLADRLLAALVLITVYALVWQCAGVFLRTDAYAVLANALRCHNLYRATQLVTKRRLWRLTADEAAELAAVSAHDHRVARWFGIVHLAGGAVLGWALVTLVLPYLVTMSGWLLTNLRDPDPAGLPFWESIAVLLILLLQWAGPPLLAVRERRMRRAGALH
ncbi:hypothetical protein [Catenuloplanes indicus]|uniref:Uncharacterized protein n=1 Tax=Catenuloplanes indicus TaxID=137267 RepID=A0AAE3VVF3_9ACTN|nr:hypothetical protein [Catenuloplanes indicus]MDQ0364978.1 hypothetical protein [Catenuloplanes indicus]